MNLGPLHMDIRALRLAVQADQMNGSFRVGRIQPLHFLMTSSETIFHMLIWDSNLIELSGV